MNDEFAESWWGGGEFSGPDGVYAARVALQAMGCEIRRE